MTFFQLVGRGYQPVEGTTLVALPAVIAPEVKDVLAGPQGATAEMLAVAAIGVSGMDTGDEPLDGSSGAAVAAVRGCCLCFFFFFFPPRV
jgi:hypothetical protein